MNRQLISLVLFLIISFTSPMWSWTYADEVNYCHDKESWKEWDELIKKHPHDVDIQMLHAVRIGFCKKIEDGSITFKAANKTFNRLHEMVIRRAKESREQWLKGDPL